MNVYEPTYYSKFVCSNKKCIDTCCSGFDVELDAKSKHVYDKFEGKLKKLVESNIVFLNGNYYIKNIDNKCVFLTDDKLCKLQQLGGESALCFTCKIYPRFKTTFRGLESRGLSLSCPTAADLILKCELNAYSFFVADDEMAVSKLVELLNKEAFKTNEIKLILSKINTREFQNVCFTEINISPNIRNLLSENETYNICRYLYFRYLDDSFIRWKNVTYWFVATISYLLETKIISSTHEIYKVAKDFEHTSTNLECFNNNYLYHFSI